MDEYRMSQVLGNVSDDLLLEAVEVRKKRSGAGKWVRLAACLAVMVGLLAATLGLYSGGDDIVGLLGILTVSAYSADQTVITLTEPDTVQYGQFGVVSPLLGDPFCNAFTLSVPDEFDAGTNIHFALSFEGGVFCLRGEEKIVVSDVVSVANHATVYWTMKEAVTAPSGLSVETRTTAHVRILVYDGEMIIGYSVLRLNALSCEELAKISGKGVAHGDSWLDVSPENFIYCSGSSHITSTYSIEMLESVYYPKVDGEYQYISEEFVVDRCKEVIAK